MVRTDPKTSSDARSRHAPVTPQHVSITTSTIASLIVHALRAHRMHIYKLVHGPAAVQEERQHYTPPTTLNAPLQLTVTPRSAQVPAQAAVWHVLLRGPRVRLHGLSPVLGSWDVFKLPPELI